MGCEISEDEWKEMKQWWMLIAFLYYKKQVLIA
jgi:hypothetical protein